MDQTLVGGTGGPLPAAPDYFTMLGGTGKAHIRRPGEFVSAGRVESNHLVFPFSPEVSAVHAILWYGALGGRRQRALYAVDVSRNGLFLPSQDVAIKDVPRWKVDARAIADLAVAALEAVRNLRRGLPQPAQGFVPADHPSFPPERQWEYKESALVGVIERLAGSVGVACLDELAPPGKEIGLLRMVRDPSNANVVRIEPGALRLKERAASKS